MIETTKKQFALRISPSLFQRLAAMAKRNKRSVNSEIEHALEQHTGINPQPFPLRGSEMKYNDPFEPAAVDDWDSIG